MRALCLLLVLCAACTKKPAAKTPTPTPPTETETKPEPTKDQAPDSKAMERKGDPCEGGEKPH